MLERVSNRSHCSLFVQRGNNCNDLVPIAICSSLLDGGPAWACNSSILCVHLFFQLLPRTSASLGALAQSAATGSLYKYALMSWGLIVLWHAYSLPQITMETLSAEAGLDAMVLVHEPAYIRGCDAEMVDLK